MHGIRLYAKVSSSLAPRKVKHYIGGLPPELTGGRDIHELMPLAHVLVLQQRDHGYALDRFASDGTWGGDTWHRTLEDAKHQADFEYGDDLGTWIEIPQDAAHAVAYVLSQLST